MIQQQSRDELGYSFRQLLLKLAVPSSLLVVIFVMWIYSRNFMEKKFLSWFKIFKLVQNLKVKVAKMRL